MIRRVDGKLEYNCTIEDTQLDFHGEIVVSEIMNSNMLDMVRGLSFLEMTLMKVEYMFFNDYINPVDEGLVAFEYPREVEFLDEIPKTVGGKTDRKKLKDMAGVE